MLQGSSVQTCCGEHDGWELVCLLLVRQLPFLQQCKAAAMIACGERLHRHVGCLLLVPTCVGEALLGYKVFFVLFLVFFCSLGSAVADWLLLCRAAVDDCSV